MISKRMTLAMTTMIVAALFLSMGVFSADAIKHQHSTLKSRSAGEASPTAVEMEETTTTLKEHLLDPALNTDEVRDAAKQVGHIADMDAYLAAIEHKMDVLAEHPAHNVREDIRDIKLGPRGAFVTSRPQFFLSSSFGRLFSERREYLFLFACTESLLFFFLSGSFVYVARSMIFRAFTDDDDDDGALACFLPRDRNVTKILTVSADF